jgi:hypothetical protein
MGQLIVNWQILLTGDARPCWGDDYVAWSADGLSLPGVSSTPSGTGTVRVKLEGRSENLAQFHNVISLIPSLDGHSVDAATSENNAWTIENF